MKEDGLNRSCSVEIEFRDGSKRYYLVLYNDNHLFTIIYHKYSESGNIKEFGLSETANNFYNYYHQGRPNRELPKDLLELLKIKTMAERV